MLSDDRDEPAPPGAVGRLAVDREASPLMWFAGYVGDPEGTAASFTRDGRWYLTGDTADMDAAGCHRFSARAGDVIVTAGHRIAPFEVESVLMLHEDVTEAVVIGVPTHAAARCRRPTWCCGRRRARVRAGGRAQADGAREARRPTRCRAWCTSSTRCRALPGARSGGLRCASGGRTGESPWTVDAFLITIPPLVVYLTVGLVVGVESLGVPLPGEIVLVSAALLSSRHELGGLPAVDRGRRHDGSGDRRLDRLRNRPPLRMGLFAWAGRRMPRHFGPSHVRAAERLFARWGVFAVFFGRFVALLRIFAGPLAGALRMHYRRFLAANVLGGICWAAGTTFAVYLLGIVAERWLQRFSWIGLVVAVVAGLTIGGSSGAVQRVWSRRR